MEHQRVEASNERSEKSSCTGDKVMGDAEKHQNLGDSGNNACPKPLRRTETILEAVRKQTTLQKTDTEILTNAQPLKRRGIPSRPLVKMPEHTNTEILDDNHPLNQTRPHRIQVASSDPRLQPESTIQENSSSFYSAGSVTDLWHCTLTEEDFIKYTHGR